nr:MAG TPA: hypothetical protein [Caudoviricetes sp.]
MPLRNLQFVQVHSFCYLFIYEIFYDPLFLLSYL